MTSKPSALVNALFVDANVFLRLLTNDIPEQAEAAQNLLSQAERGEVRLTTNVLAVAEVVWTLRSFYKQPTEAIREAVLAICYQPGLDTEERDSLVQAAEWMVEKNVDFADAYHAAWSLARGCEGAVTFNLKHFRRFEELPARKP